MLHQKREITAIWTCDPEDPSLCHTLESYLDSLTALSRPCRLIIVINGDASRISLKLQQMLEGAEIPTTLVELCRHSDTSTAFQTALGHTDSETLVVLPSYHQVDLGCLPEMLELIEDGCGYVGSWRNPRVDSYGSRLRSAAFNRFTGWLTGARFHDINSGLRVMQRAAIENTTLHGELDRFLPVLAMIQGYRVAEVPTRHLQERTAKGDAHVNVYCRRLLDLLAVFFLVRFTQKPLRFFGVLGGTTLAAGAAGLAVLCVQRLQGAPLSDRPLLLFAALALVLGVQLFSLGLLGELFIFTHGRSTSGYAIEKIYESGTTS